MKRIFLAVGSLFLAIIICFFGVFILNKSCNEIASELNKLALSIETGNMENIKKSTENVIVVWEKADKRIEMLTKHAETDELQKIIKSLPVYAQMGDKDRLFEETKFALNKIEHILGNEKIHLSNIF